MLHCICSVAQLNRDNNLTKLVEMSDLTTTLKRYYIRILVLS